MLSERLKKSRKSMGKTQRDLAKYLGISERGYQNYEMGKREPSLEALNQLADYFGVSTDYLLGRTNDADEIFSQPLLSKKLFILSCKLRQIREDEGLTPKEMAHQLDIPEEIYLRLENSGNDAEGPKQALL